MEKRYYKCTFLTDVILNSNSATEGHSESLEYIPGSNFLGVIAKNYQHYEKQNKAYEIFHSGNVHFGDGHLLINEKRSIKKPASWFHLKTDIEKKEIYLHHKITDEMRRDFSNNGKQFKQIRNGFFQIEKNEIISKNVLHTYSIKSSHDMDKRKAKDEAMYGYDALDAGSEWIFFIDAETENYKLIEDKLIGEKSIGRSRSAQYGRVKIEKFDYKNPEIAYENNATDYENNSILLIYFDSCAMFLDKYLQPTYQPDFKNLLLTKDCKIRWNLSQIRTKNYAPWNGKRKTRDYDRVCIDKGSVIAVEIAKKFDFEDYIKKVEFGIGLFKNEGLGQVLINPIFLTKANVNSSLDFNITKCKEEDINLTNQIVVQSGSEDDSILRCLENRENEKANQFAVLEKVNLFLKDNANKMNDIKSSQWGQVRALAMTATDKDDLIRKLFLNDKGFLVCGKAKKQWDKYRKWFEAYLNSLSFNDDQFIKFVINISSDMAKKARKGGK